MDNLVSHRIIIYIPTWKRPDVIDRVLSEELAFLKELNIDICIYDSSPNEETLDVVRRFESEYSNLKYEKVDERIPSNEKYFDICKRESYGDYEYVWIIQDHLIFTKEAAEYLLKMLDNRADFYYLDMMSGQYAYREENCLNEFAINSAWMLTRFGTAILRTDSFLREIDWADKKRWLNNKTINNSHIGLYFERLAEMQQPRIGTISFLRDQFYDFMRFQPVAWSDELLRICLECWGTTIYRLPSIYNKKEIIKSQDSLFISSTQLLTMKTNRQYGFCTYMRYRKWIKIVYPEREKEFRDIAFLSSKKAERKYIGKIIEAVKQAQKNEWNIYIFGAGRHAFEFSRYIEQKGIEFDGFLVSQKFGNPEKVGKHQILDVNQELENKNALIIIAVALGSVDSIKQLLNEVNHKEIKILSLAR